jgi:hypothetical protein
MIVKSCQQASGCKRYQGHEATGYELSTHPRAVAKEAKETPDNESRDWAGSGCAEKSSCGARQEGRDKATRKERHPTPCFEVTDQPLSEKHRSETQ